MAIYANAGTRLYVSSDLPATNTQAGFEAVGIVWDEVSNVGNIGIPFDSFAEVSYQTLAGRRTQYAKGSIDPGSLTAEMAYDPENDGQIMLMDAHASDNAYSFKAVYTSGEIRYVQAKVFGMDQPAGGNDDVIVLNMSARPTDAVVKVLP